MKKHIQAFHGLTSKNDSVWKDVAKEMGDENFQAISKYSNKYAELKAKYM